MAELKDAFEKSLYDLIMQHLGMLKNYVPGPVKKAGGTRGALLKLYQSDPMFSVFGLDSPEYIAATLGGGTVTSIHRKLGDIFEQCVAAICGEKLGLEREDLTYTAEIQSGANLEKRSADVYVEFAKVKNASRRRKIEKFCQAELVKIARDPKITLVGVGMEVRHCYQTGDSKRAQADEAMARHLFVSGILPLMPLFCGQSNPGIVKRYRTVWVVKEAREAYDAVRCLSGYDLHGFLKRNREDFRKPVIEMLRGLSK